MHKWKYSIILMLNLTSCAKEKVSPPLTISNTTLTQSQLIGFSNISKIKKAAIESGYEDFVDLIKYPVTIYKIEYKTKLLNKTIIASGLIVLPFNTTKSLPILIANHGTLTKKNLAPTESPKDYELIVMASAGYITIIPDYIGFGSSKQYLHPYYISSYIHQSIVDITAASKEFLLNNYVPTNNKVFLFGYSEGGYVSLGTHKSLEEHKILSVTASVSGAGGYNLENVLNEIVNKTTYDSPSYLAYIIYSYNTYYEWELPLDSFFTKKYASKIPELFNGDFGLNEINQSLDNRLDSLFNKNFLARLKNKTESHVLPALRENSITDWTPKNPVQLYHGTLDQIVPFSDSEAAYQTFKDNGTINIEFYPLEGKDHRTGLNPMIRFAIPWFQTLNVDF